MGFFTKAKKLFCAKSILVMVSSKDRDWDKTLKQFSTDSILDYEWYVDSSEAKILSDDLLHAIDEAQDHGMHHPVGIMITGDTEGKLVIWVRPEKKNNEESTS